MGRAVIVSSVAALLTGVILIIAVHLPPSFVAASEKIQPNWLHRDDSSAATTGDPSASTKDDPSAAATNEPSASTTDDPSASTKDKTDAFYWFVPLLITELRWAADWQDGNYSLTVCSNSTLSETGEETTVVKLMCNGTEININPHIEGKVVDDKCAVFLVDFILPLSPTTYKLDVTFPKKTRKEGIVTVAMTVETSILKCAESIYTKLSWSTRTQLLDHTCIADPMTVSNTCYSEGNLTDTNFCFAVEGETTDNLEYNVTVCQKGQVDYAASETTDDSFAVSYVLYGDGKEIEPSLALSYNGNVLTVIVSRDDNKLAVFGCDGLVCPLPRMVPGPAQYRVCGEVVGGGPASDPQTATANFTDLNLIQLPGDPLEQGSVLQFMFANALSGKVYMATVLLSLPPCATRSNSSVAVDCTLVLEENACFGFMNIEGLAGTVYLAVSSAVDDTNKVIFPYDLSVSTTTETAETVPLLH